MSAAAEVLQPSRLFTLTQASVADLHQYILNSGGLGEQFFYESEFHTFTDLDLKQARLTMAEGMQTGHVVALLGWYKDEPAGFIMFTVERLYTTDPMAMLYLFYVRRQRRLTPLGRALLNGAEQVSRAMGAVVFYAGATANMGHGIDERLMNLLDKRDYLRLGGVARKLLRDES